MSKIRKAVAAAKSWLKSFFLSIHNVATESRKLPNGALEYRVTFDSNLGRHSTPWVSKEEAEAIFKRMTS